MSSVKLIGITQPHPSTGCEIAAELVAYAARVSNPSNQNNKETSANLLRYLIKHKHWSPFEMVSITMEIKTTRDIGRQILRHRSFSFQEFCVAEGTLITTLQNCGKSKKVPIEDLYKRYITPQYSEMSDWLVRAYEPEKGLIPVKIKEVFKTGIKPCFKITLDSGKTIESTEKHKYLAIEGFKALKDLKVGDAIATNGIPIYQDKDWLSQAKERAILEGTGVQGIADEAGCSYHTIRKWLGRHKLQFSKKEVASYTPAWNKGLDKELQPNFGKAHSKETRAKMRESAKKGSDSNLYINGNYTKDSIGWRKRVTQICKGSHTTLLVNQDYKCAECGCTITRSTSEVDHVKPIYSNPELAFEESNLQALCKKCHSIKSIKESTMARETIKYELITNIEFIGDRMTYDIEVEHTSHNYIANGIVTHNSQRYAEATNFETREPRLQDKKNRQNSLEIENDELKEVWEDVQTDLLDHCTSAYCWALDRGIAKEQARALLPEGLTQTTMYMAGTLRSWLHYCDLRTGPETQKEHRIVAKQCWDVIVKEFPYFEEFKKQG